MIHSTTPAALKTLQDDREAVMLADGLARATNQDARAATLGEQTRLEKLTLEHLIPLSRRWLEGYLARDAGSRVRRPEWVSVVAKLDLDVVVAAALRQGFSLAMKLARRTNVLASFGDTLDLLRRHGDLQAAAEGNRKKKSALAAMKRGRSTWGIKRAIAKATEKLEPWSQDEKVAMGAGLWNIAISSGMFAILEEPDEGGRVVELWGLSEQGQRAAAEIVELGLLARPIFRPMVTKPAPWRSLTTGAYRTEEVSRRVPLVRTWDRAHLAMLEKGIKAGSMDDVLAAVNAIQEVPLAIHREVLALRKWAWENGVDIKDVLPLRSRVAVKDPKEINAAPVEDQNRLWMIRAAAVRVNKGVGPNIVAFDATTQEAEDLATLADHGVPFYLPHNMDFRGRVYPVPSFNHHSGDATKALIRFHRGKPLGEFGLTWLMVHVANTGDFGKVSKKAWEDRVAWVQENLDLVTATADRPHEDLRWTQADKPFSFYAACLDLARALRNPEGPEAHVSYLPIALDGSNSGVQHYSALMRAEEGRWVNLTDTEAPEDLYTQVRDGVAGACQKALRRVSRALGYTPTQDDAMALYDRLGVAIGEIAGDAGLELRLNATQKRRIAKLKRRRSLAAMLLWQFHGIGRSDVKRPVMTFGYSSVAFGMAKQVLTDTMGPLGLGVLRGVLERHPFGADEGKHASLVMGSMIYRATCAALPRVAGAMEWLKKVATVLAQANKGVLVVAPDGFPMLMRETEWETKRVELMLLGKEVEVREMATVDHDATGAPEPSPGVDRGALQKVRITVRTGTGPVVLAHKQASGVAPNVIHTMDAAHLRKTALSLHRDYGVEDLLLIHDSFAAHASEVGLMSVVLRAEMVALYEDYCPLQDILERGRRALSKASNEAPAALPEPPAKGSLDLQEINQASFAFS
jgi:DNA-directed RNA polymerase